MSRTGEWYNTTMDPHSLKVLEFDRIKDALSERVSCGLGQHFVDRLEPSTNPAFVRARMAETTECRRFLDVEGRLPFGGLNDCTSIVREASAGGMLRAEELLQLVETLDAMRRLRTAITSRPEQYTVLGEIASKIGVYVPLMQRIQHCIGERAEVLDRASAELGRIRSAIGITRSRLGQRLEAVLRNSAYKLMVQDPVLVQRAGRTCIPIKLEYRTQFPGLVHDQSSSGQTVFMEPTEALEIGNEVRRLELDEETEIQRILQELSGAVGAEAAGIRESLVQAGILDFINARAAYSRDTEAVPPILSDSGLVVLVKARHPLLGEGVVPLDIELNNDRRTVVITGPNTGGKTVALKTTGLLALMAQAGLHVPADKGTRLPLFPAIFADIGDEQSIQQSLSTFSSHIRQIVKTVVNLEPGSLVLLDELGAGTDPLEGAALATTLIETFTGADARTIVTTHYGELKEFAYQAPGVENASMEFDEETLSPTYRLHMGVPGRSLALVIAARLGLPEDLIDRARSRVRYEERSAWEMLRQLEQDRRETAEAREQAVREAREAERLRERRQRELADLDRRRKEILEQAAAEVQAAVRQGQEQVRQIIADQREQSERRTPIHQATEALGAMDRELSEVRRRAAARPAARPPADFHPRVGMSVRVPRFAQKGMVVEACSDDQFMVAMGNLKLRVSASELEPASGEPARSIKDPVHELRQQKAGAVSDEIKLLGLRADEAVSELDKYLDDAMLSGLKQVRVIHGRGTGALKHAVWQWLRSHHAVQSYRIGQEGEGGSGATVVELSQQD